MVLSRVGARLTAAFRVRRAPGAARTVRPRDFDHHPAQSSRVRSRQSAERNRACGQEEQVHILNPFIVGTVDVGTQELAGIRQVENDALMDGADKMTRARLSKADFRKLMFGQSLRRKLEGGKY